LPLITTPQYLAPRTYDSIVCLKDDLTFAKRDHGGRCHHKSWRAPCIALLEWGVPTMAPPDRSTGTIQTFARIRPTKQVCGFMQQLLHTLHVCTSCVARSTDARMCAHANTPHRRSRTCTPSVPKQCTDPCLQALKTRVRCLSSLTLAIRDGRPLIAS
jgi:hypothetical protein